VDGAATATTTGRSTAEGDTQGCTFLVDRVRPSRQDVSPRGKVMSASAMPGLVTTDTPFCSRFSVRRIPATGKVQAATASALTSAEAVSIVESLA
jgi:hypothetical protein